MKIRGYIVDNAMDYPGGNVHGVVAFIDNEWYIFYHKTTDDTVMARRECVENYSWNWKVKLCSRRK